MGDCILNGLKVHWCEGELVESGEPVFFFYVDDLYLGIQQIQ